MHIKKYCMILVYFDERFDTINYTENMTPVLQYLSNFSVLLVIQDRVDLKNSICFYNSLFFKIVKSLIYYEDKIVLTSY